MKEEQKTNVKFKDEQNNLWNIEIEITHRNGYPEFTMSGENGQCQDRIKPANKQQKRLFEIWNEWHLNGLHAGTEKQTEMIEEMKKKKEYDYEKAKSYLNSFDKDRKPINHFDLIEIEQERKYIQEQIDEVEKEINIIKRKKELISLKAGGGFVIIKELNISEHYNTDMQFKNIFNKEFKKREVKLEDLKQNLEKTQEKTLLYDYGTDGKLYEYGSTWHRRELPKNLWKEIEQLVKEIQEIEEAKKIEGGSWEDIDDYKIVALGKYLELEPKEAQEDITTEDEETYNYCGIEYYVLTEDEAYNKAEDYLGDEMWEMVVTSGNTELGKKEWIEYVIEEDGVGEILNGYDGTEYYDNENKVYIMRC